MQQAADATALGALVKATGAVEQQIQANSGTHPALYAKFVRSLSKKKNQRVELKAKFDNDRRPLKRWIQRFRWSLAASTTFRHRVYPDRPWARPARRPPTARLIES